MITSTHRIRTKVRCQQFELQYYTQIQGTETNAYLDFKNIRKIDYLMGYLIYLGAKKGIFFNILSKISYFHNIVKVFK